MEKKNVITILQNEKMKDSHKYQELFWLVVISERQTDTDGYHQLHRESDFLFLGTALLSKDERLSKTLVS